MPICPHCGREVSKGVEYCPSCGERLKKEFSPEERERYVQELEASIAEEKRVKQEQEEERKREKKEARERELEEYRKKADKEWAKKSKTARIAMIVGVVALLAAVPTILCIRTAQLKSTPEAIAAAILGTPKGDTDSGVISATYDGGKLEVEYQFFPLGQFAVEKEASYKLVPMFKKVFSETPASEVVVYVMGPFRDQYGNITWMPVLTLGITRTSFEKIHWSNIANTEFYMACDTYWKPPLLTV